jgi:hypothetical protein
MVDNEVLDHKQLQRLARKIAERDERPTVSGRKKERKP